MKTRATAVAIGVVLLLMAGAGASPARAADVSFSFFYSNLSPHGSWLVSAQYGRVWQPSIYVADWNPYYDGHWVYADVGWTWVSDYRWGGIPYHYGTWAYDPFFGWVWVPGYVWAPSWVVFRTGPGYIGWAPVAPGFTVGVSATFGAGVSSPFVFVSSGDFVARRIRSCVIPEQRARVIINNTTVMNTLVVERNVVVNRGPDVSIIEKAVGRKIREVPIEEVTRAGPGRRITRDEIAVETRGRRQALRAAEPVKESTPLPDSRERSARERGRTREQVPRPDGGNGNGGPKWRSTAPRGEKRESESRMAAERSDEQRRERQESESRMAEQRKEKREGPSRMTEPSKEKQEPPSRTKKPSRKKAKPPKQEQKQQEEQKPKEQGRP